MADRNTVINGDQIKDATVTEDELNASVAGDGIGGGAGSALFLDLNELTGAVVDVSADSIAIVDANDSNASRKETIADLVSAIAGSGLTATAGVLSADAVTDNVVESDFAKEDLSSSTDGVETDFVLVDVPVTATLQVYLNGLLQQEGSGFDFELNPDSGDTKKIRFTTAPETADLLIIHYVKDN